MCSILPLPYSIDPEHNIPSFRARKIWQMLGALNVHALYERKFLYPERYKNGEVMKIQMGHKEVGLGVDSYTSQKCLINYYDA